MRHQVLFVDDEDEVLRGLRRLLHGFRNEWNMQFATSGAEGLELLEKSDFDVVVSDMRMPGMDGVEFLRTVAEKHPNAVRIVLSGQADQREVMNSVDSTHQYLAKPCDPDVLKTTVARACKLKDMVESQPIKSLASRITSLPGLPSVYQSLMEAIKDPDIGVQDIGKIIELDVGMTAQMLKVVNSALFGLSREVSSAGQAVNVLGIEMVKALVLSLGVFSQFDIAPELFSIDSFQSHSQEVARNAKLISQTEGADAITVSNSFLAGFLHDIGKLILIDNLTDDYQVVLKRVHDEKIALVDAEMEAFEVSHADVGAYLLGLWGLPAQIVEAIGFHHKPSECPGDFFTPLTAVHIANSYSHCQNVDQPNSGLDVAYLQEIGREDRVTAWYEVLGQGNIGE